MNRHLLPFSSDRVTSVGDYAFSERSFTPASASLDTYVRDVSVGYERMRNRRVVIAGLARDVADILPKTIARIERQGRFFGDYRVIIYENDSSDETPKLLNYWQQQNPRVTVVSETLDEPVNHPTRCLDRARRMAFYRARCQDSIRKNYARFDNVMLIDTDLVGGWSYDGVAHTFAHDGWDFVGANGIIYRRQWMNPNAFVQYDAWAFRRDTEFTPITTKEVNHILYRRGQPLQPLCSSFGGVGLYAMEPYLAGEYRQGECEHVTFHQSLHEQGFSSTYLNPNLIAVYGRKHRTLDRFAAAFIRFRDLLTLGRPTVWEYPREDDRLPQDNRHSKRRAA